MTTKEKLLALLEDSKGTFFSGEEIARALQVSRAAVWKAVNALREDGYTIDAVTNKGYRLSPDSDILSPGHPQIPETGIPGSEFDGAPHRAFHQRPCPGKGQPGLPGGLRHHRL